MENTKKTILVPTNFAKVADYALEHAIGVSTVINGTVILIHVVGSSDYVPDAERKLGKLVQDAQRKYGVLPEFRVTVGDVIEEITRTTASLNPSFVIMGSESIKGRDELSGSWTLKLISRSLSPFITVQEPVENKRYDEVVLPIDYTLTNKQSHKWISYFCSYYISHFHLVKPFVTDPELLAKVDLNMASAIHCLNQHGARYEIYTVPGEQPYAQEILNLARSIKSDLIIIMSAQNGEASSFVMQTYEQFIISNAGNIPVMSINPV